ncbi:GDSL-type esterase/lipase family protein [uncultured Cyclobacterium sp.]|uniref:SGNH/GDSL hydrolase family protein n=1 Tax=uncultured Cyclobacterium sp. TaxID=453820 RepID=UPI0030EE924C
MANCLYVILSKGKYHLPIAYLLILSACNYNQKMLGNKNNATNESPTRAINYLALGDSYTIGEGETTQNAYPWKIAKILANEEIKFNTKVIAKTGWTSSELLQALSQEKIAPNSYDIASILIGVNNQYRGQSTEQFHEELIELIETTQSFLKSSKKHIVLVSIPDWGITRFGQSSKKPQDQISKEINAFNRVIIQEATKYGLPYINITESYRENGGNAENMVEDGLHPSRYIYKEWAFQLSKIFRELQQL